METAMKMISFILWATVAVLVVPCLLVSTFIYPAWDKWGEKF